MSAITDRSTTQETTAASSMVTLHSDRNRHFDWLVAVPLVVALALRLYRLDYQSLWGDEAFALRLAREPLDRIIPMLSASEPHPPLYYGLLHVWRGLTGESDFALRLLSALFSVIAVAAVYGLGRHLADRGTAFAAALITAANPFQVWYAQETRMYSMLVATTAVATLLFYTALSRGGGRRWLAYTAVAAISIFTQYHALFIVAFHNVAAVLWWLRTRRRPSAWPLSQAALVVVFLPWLFFAQSIFRQWSGWMARADLPEMIARSFSAHMLGTSFPSEWVSWTSAVLAGWAVVALVRLVRNRAQAAVFVVLYALAPLFGAWLLGELLGRSMFHERYLIAVSPAFYLLLGYGFGWCNRRSWLISWVGIAVVLAAGAVSLNNHYFDWRYQKDDLRALATYIDANQRDGDIVVASITKEWLYQHYAKVPVPLYLIPPEAMASEIPSGLAGVTAGYRRALFLPYSHSEVDAAVEQWMTANAYPADVRWFNTARVEVAGLAASIEQKAISVSFDNRVRLEEFGLSAASLEPGDVVGISTRWRAEQRIEDLKVSLRLVDNRFRVYAQSDRGFTEKPPGSAAAESWTQNVGLLSPVDTPPGNYQVELHLYDQAGRELAVIDELGARQGTSFALGQIRVEPAGRPAPPSAQVVKHRSDATFGATARLTGYDFPESTWQAGEKITFSLSWQAVQPDGRAFRPVLRLRDGTGTEVGKRTIVDGPSPVATWRAGQLTREIQDWRLSPALRDGQYSLTIGLESPDGSPLKLSSGANEVALRVVSVAARPRYALPDPPQNPTSFTIGPFARLDGYDLDQKQLRPGEELRLTLHWQALEETEESYKVFTHVLSTDERVIAQDDSVPCRGTCPTTAWAESERLADAYTLAVTPDTKPGRYLVEIGMYNPADLKRLPVRDASGLPIGDRIILAEIEVR